MSAHTPQALQAHAQQLIHHLHTHPHHHPHDIAHTLATRHHFKHRATITATDRQSLVDGLAAVTNGAGTLTGTAREQGKVAFVFPGQGSQWVGMATELMRTCDTFADRMAECAEALAPYVTWSLAEVLQDARQLERVDVVQPALFAVMVSLAAVWESYGVVPDAVVGHSQGEIAAAVVAGALSLDDGARVVAQRSQVLLALSGRGAMMWVDQPVDEVRRAIGDGIEVAVVNGPSSVVIAGAVEALTAYQPAGVRTRLLPVDYASHSAHVEEVRDQLVEVLDGVQSRRARVPFMSTVTGGWLDTRDLDVDYWYRNLRQTVLFEPALRALQAAGFTTVVEVSPHPVLTVPIEQTLPDAVVTGSLHRDEGTLDRFRTSVMELYVQGGVADLVKVCPGRTVELPTYPFVRQRYWLDGPRAVAGAAIGVVTEAAEPEGPVSPLAERLHGLDTQERQQVLLELVRREAATVLGHSGPDAVEENSVFRDLGFDSLTAVRLRGRLATVSGLQLPPTLVFNHPTPVLLAGHLGELLAGGAVVEPVPVPVRVGQRTGDPVEPIAIVAMSCRLPGGIRSPEELWELL
ncbi:acyltransferase domain-containing protein, partial [Couchioplanes azureus]|uniref:acyltransferase domain-containing protein n=1 Tax=Couchioplanes caeruleus TaxID=56438 RepID=UPI00366F0F21